jgi:hypothetical protein
MILLRLAFLSLIVIASTTTNCQDLCTGFGSGLVHYQYIHVEFSSAIVRVQDVGTAYLVDAESGYLLTAGHVLQDMALKNEDMRVIMGQYPYSVFSFKVVKRSDIADVALLQLVPSNAMRKVRPLDIAFVPPDFDTPLFAMGYPQYGNPSQITLKDGSVSFAGLSPGGMIEINHVTIGGDSGGALIDANGDAVAICEEETAEGMKGRYLPILSIAEILREIPVSKRMRDLESQIINDQIDLDSLKRLLTKTSQGQGPSNLELFVWIQSLRKSPESLNKIARYLKCPLLQVVTERHIPEAILPFMDRLDATDTSKVDLRMAQREYSLGHNQSAAQFATGSIEVRSSDEIVAFARQRALLLKTAIEDQKTLGRAEVVQQHIFPMSAEMDSGTVANYLIQWMATIDSKTSETGHPSEPLKGSLTDNRKCQWEIRTEILRRVYHIDPKEQTAKETSVDKVFSGGFANQGSDFVFQNLRPENCNDSAGRYQSDLKDARSAVGAVFPTVISKDREVVASDISHLPHVKRVYVPPEAPSNLQMLVY